MPRVYKRKLGARQYANYSSETLEKCLNDVRNKVLTQRAAAAVYKIPRSTIKNKLAGLVQKKAGGQTIFTNEEENAFVSHLITMSEFSFPLTALDFRHTVKLYLSAKGITIKKFKDNLPGADWLKGFMTRHPSLSARLASNIKRARAEVSEETISNYMQNLKSVIEGVPPENIWNYDETNLSDNPGSKKVLCKRGSKYPENIVNSSKTSFSIMFCGNAAGFIIPPYVVYKSEHLWSTWQENGPRGARYNRTKHGWFDGLTYEDWFVSHMLPILKKLTGKTASYKSKCF